MIVPSIRALAPLTGLSHTALNKHLKAGRFQAEPEGGFDPDTVRAALGLPPSSPGEPPPELPAAGMRIEMWPIDRPIPYPKNARKWSERAIATVAASIREYGFRQPIVVDAAGVIVIGHLRLAAAKSLDLKEVPVHVARDLTPAQIKGLRIADNRTSQEATWDFDLLGPELLDLKSMDFDLSLTGFDPAELNTLLGHPPAAGDGSEKSQSLAERFGVPPFSVLDARQGYWQDRKRAWLTLGIQSELGRGGGVHQYSDAATITRQGGTLGSKGGYASPGGSPRPACDYKNRERGDGAGRPMA